MTPKLPPPVALSGICEVEFFPAGGGDPEVAPELLIEIPHGATRGAHFDDLRRRLVGPFPDDLEAFFFVNTDVGAPECARHIARSVAGPGTAIRPLSAVILRSLIPRTFVDCNRCLTHSTDDFARAGFTPGLPEYVTDPADIALLHALHRQYTEQAERAFAWVCGAGGSALTLHTYAPRFVTITKIDERIVRALREAYSAEQYDRWEPRPDVDVISEADDGSPLAAAELVAAVRRHYAAAGVTATENATYRLNASTMGYVHCVRHPGRVLALEINRARLADPFTPFAEMHISDDKAREMALPIAAAYLERAAAGVR